MRLFKIVFTACFAVLFLAAIICPAFLFAEEEGSRITIEQTAYMLEPIVVTAPAIETPIKVSLDPKAPQQPLPAEDGASFLKLIPGMEVVRKGGTDGDPVFRGMAGSRLTIMIDGQMILGGCGNRMDPPTAYVFPDTFDKVTLIKGPQSVLYGPGSSAGVVLFERKVKRYENPELDMNASVMAGSFGRHDEVLDLTVGSSNVYFRGAGTNSSSDNFKDGNGDEVHSEYKRWSGTGAVGWTPDDNTTLELSGVISDGESAYADRTVDGIKFARKNLGIKFEKKDITPSIQKIEANAYYNYVDHVMDNYTLRNFISMGTGHEPSSMNPDRKTEGGKLVVTLNPTDTAIIMVGGDLQTNKHTLRTSMSMLMGGMFTPGQLTNPYQNMPRIEDASFSQKGLFIEATQSLSEKDKVIGGIRSDWWRTEDKRKTVINKVTTNPTANHKRNETLLSGFIRYEMALSGAGSTLYTGIGHTNRFPDYWELFKQEGPNATDLSAFDTTKPEKTTQIDIAVNSSSDPWTGFVSIFGNKINDFIMVQSNVTRGAGMMTRSAVIVRNIDATTWGGEAGMSYAFTKSLKSEASISYVHGQNDTENRPLAQIPPFEGNVGLNWNNDVWSLGSLLRIVTAQKRYAISEGTIVGQDIGRTSGFTVFSINGGWKPIKGLLIAAGVDNLFDKVYAEHISRAGTNIVGFEQTTRVNEPGRNFWGKITYSF
jgi:iron complex outermembrane recepter protein